MFLVLIAIGVFAAVLGIVFQPVLGLGFLFLAIYIGLCLRWRSLAVFAVIAPVLVSSATISDLTGLGDALAVQKLLVLCGVVFLILMSGIRLDDAPVITLLVFFALCFVLTNVFAGQLEANVVASSVNALIGYVFPWTMCFIAWRRIAPSAVMRAIQWSPYIAVGIGIVLQVIGVRALVLLEYTGVPRLTAGLDAAYMGAVAMFGVIASVWLWLRGNSVSLFWALGSLLMTLASGTRGATVVALIVFLAAMLFSGAAGGAKKGIVRVVALVIGLGVILNAVPLLIDRATNSGSAQGALSGRDSAWSFFWLFVEERPWFGNGIGANSQLNVLSNNTVIAEYFFAPHNTYLQFILDFGVVGSLVALVAFVAIFRKCLQGADRSGRLIIWSLIPAIGFYAFFDNLLASPHPAVLFVLILLTLGRTANEPDGAGSVSEAEKSIAVRTRHDGRPPRGLQLS